jgi:hypothetical protein
MLDNPADTLSWCYRLCAPSWALTALAFAAMAFVAMAFAAMAFVQPRSPPSTPETKSSQKAKLQFSS